MPRIIIVVFLSFFVVINLSGQVYHHETGKVLSVNRPNQIIWKKGTYNNYPADYGTLIVKENRNNRRSRLINIPIIRVKSLNTDSIQNPIFLLNGGPGESNFQPQLFFDKLTNEHDVVIVGYRGVDGSVKLDCPCMSSTLMSDTITIDNSSKLFQVAFDSCIVQWKNRHIDITGYSMDEVVDDIEAVREIIGYNQISFLSFSYGTMLSQLYNQKYTGRVDKMVLIGARPLNDFLFRGDDFNNLFYQLFKQYTQYSNSYSADSIDLVLNSVNNKLNSICYKNEELNLFRFLFFGFSKLYAMDDREKLFSAYYNAINSNPNELIHLYNDFYKVFPGDFTIGDIILKKQGRVSFENSIDKNLTNNIAKVINSWYTPQVDLLYSNLPNKKVFTDSTEVMIMFGEYDVASPPMLFEDNTLSFNNFSKVIIQNAGHLDLFYSKKDEVRSYCIEFFK